MSKELVIGSNRHETKVAVLEDDQLVEIYFQRGNEYSLAGSIHKGRVTRVLPGMQSAFVDLGLERDTFLYVSDFFEEHEDIDAVTDDRPVRSDRRDYTQPRSVERASDDRNGDARDTRAEALSFSESESVAAEETPNNTLQISGEPVPIKPIERTENERGLRGDRRGRRSRRRRPRGQGFPENKYAQPPAAQLPQEPRPDQQAGEPQPSPDVILLPGESLAKYRNLETRPTDSEVSPPFETVIAQPESSDKPAASGNGPEEEQSPQGSSDQPEDLDAEADEIETADKVLSHYEDPSAEEEKLEEVKQDAPGPSSSEDLETSGQQDCGTVRFEDGHAVDENPSNVSASRELTLSSGDTEVHQQDIPPTQSLAAQTAVMRAQGGRYMHRLSRRMRRRRGGNRFNNVGNASAVTEVASSPSGATAAIHEQTRPEPFPEDQEARLLSRPERTAPSISDLLKPGQEIIVQIAKEPLGQKGARITSHVALPGRYVVFMPSVAQAGVSRKIASEEERHRLKRILQKHSAGMSGGFIVRTAGEGVSEDEIASDMEFLYNLWMDIRAKAEKKPAPALLHYDLDIVQRILRDRLTEDFKAIWVDNEELYENVLSFMQRFQPALVSRVKMYTRSAPIFDAFSITQELEKALRPKVWLKSGGYIVINQTEALVAVDINTGKFVGKSNRLEDTIVKTNTEAAKEIVRQIRLRDLGGIIVLDFIDMEERKNRQKVMQSLEEAMRADRAPYKILQFNDFGLVAITRKRVKQSLERTLCSPCPYCEGAGYIKNVQTIIGEILVEAQKIAKAIESKDVVLRVNPAVAKVLKASSNRYLEEVEETLGRPVLVTSDANLHHEKFDLA